MDKLKYCLVGIGLSFSLPAFSLSDAEIEARFKQYETEIKAMKEEHAAEIKQLENKIKRLKSPSSGPVYEQDLSRRVKRLEKESKTRSAKEDQLRISGFMTAASIMADEELGGPYEFDDRPNFRGNSKVGMQFDYKITDRSDAVIQLVARSRVPDVDTRSASWDVNAEWAFLSYDLTDSFEVRAGRFRTPVFMYSENLEVGFSYHWAQPPIEMYRVAQTSMDGISLHYKFFTGPINHRLQVYGGSWDDVVTGIKQEDTFGVNLTSNIGSWTTWLSSYEAKLDGDFVTANFSAVVPVSLFPGATCAEISPGFCILQDANEYSFPVDDRFRFYSAGVEYDNGSLFVMTEVGHLDSLNGILFPDARNGYVSGGYRIGSWSPYLSYNWDYYVKESENAFAAPNKVKSYTAGVRYNLSSAMALTAEWSYYHDFEGQGEFFSAEAIDPGDTDLDDSNVYTLSLDAVF